MHNNLNIEFPITIAPPPIIFPDGTTKQVESFEVNDLELDFIDRPRDKTVSVKISLFPKEIVLWSGDEYDAIGDWTQEQADEALNAILEEDPASILENLFQ